MNATTPADTARAAAEAIRQLNHETLRAGSMTAPEISRTVSALVDLVDRLPQTFEQLSSHLARELAAGQVRMEDERDPSAPVAQVLAGLKEAAALTSAEHRTAYGDPAGKLSAALHDASGWLFSMGAPWASDEEDDDA